MRLVCRVNDVLLIGRFAHAERERERERERETERETERMCLEGLQSNWLGAASPLCVNGIKPMTARELK